MRPSCVQLRGRGHVAIGKSGAEIVTSSSSDGSVRVWCHTASALAEVAAIPPIPGVEFLHCAASPSGDRVATTCSDGAIEVWTIGLTPESPR